MREKIAEVIAYHTNGHWTPEGLADAVLEEMTGPTARMLGEGCLAIVEFDADYPEEVRAMGVLDLRSNVCWSAMIRAAKEGK